ncbi:MAG: sensor histidine kinase [Parvibaculaceae bacterium]
MIARTSAVVATNDPGSEQGARGLRSFGAPIDVNVDFLNQVLQSSVDCIKVLDLDAHVEFLSAGGMRVLEIDDFSQFAGCDWLSFWSGDDRSTVAAAVAEARAGGAGHFQAFCPTAKGTPKWWDVVVTPIRGADGQPAKLLSISRDITELRQAAETRRLLLLEMTHRFKNVLSLVQGIATQTLRKAENWDEAQAVFSARLTALAAAHDVLTRESWHEANLRNIVEAAVAAHETERIEIEGPDLMLDSRPALALGLAIHELCTNATKYGALSNHTGRVKISWVADIARAGFKLRWREAGGPYVTPPKQKGFGSFLIEQNLASVLSAQIRLNYEPGGLVCEIDAPLRSPPSPSEAVGN